MQLGNQAYKQEAPYSTNWYNLWAMLMTQLSLAGPSASMKEASHLPEEASKEVY